MATLTLVNGAPGSGKSTIAQLYVDRHPLALNLDIDHIRRQISRWQTAPMESGTLARSTALALAEAHLRKGYDVVLPQYLGQVDFIEQLEQAAEQAAADFRELVLLTDKGEALQRFERRTLAAADPTHIEAAEMARLEAGPNALGDMYDRLLSVLALRPNTVIIRADERDPELTYTRVLTAMTG